MSRIARLALPFLLLFTLGACQSTMAPSQKSLYDRLGGQPIPRFERALKNAPFKFCRDGVGEAGHGREGLRHDMSIGKTICMVVHLWLSALLS